MVDARGGTPDFACKCLNVRLSARTPPVGSPTASGSAEYEPLYVCEDGISVAHNQLTLRTRLPATESENAENDASGSHQYLQRTVLKCLVCNTDAYRVHQDLTPETEAREGPILPTDEWAERDTLLSKSGWIEVNKGSAGCIAGEDVGKLLSSSGFSEVFHIVVPDKSSAPSSTKSMSSPEQTYLPPLPSLFPPPPFSPSHAAFLHLASIATAVSDKERRSAEERVAAYIRKQLDQLEVKERGLKYEVEKLWHQVRAGSSKAEQEHLEHLSSMPKGVLKSYSSGHGDPLTDGLASSPVIRDFIPTPITTRMRFPPSTSSPSAPSGLSTSLSTSTFHHPDVRKGRSDNSDERPLSIRRDSSSAPQSESTTTSPILARTGSGSGDSIISASSRTSVNVNIPGVFRRNMNTVQDAAVTFRYYTIEAEEAAAARDRAIAEAQRRRTASSSAPAESIAESSRGSRKHNAVPKQDALHSTMPDASETPPPSAERVGEGSTGEVKRGRRKVTFDVKPAVGETKANAEDGVHIAWEDSIFELEASDEEKTMPNGFQSLGVDGENRKLILPLQEPSPEPPRVRRRLKNIDAAGLPQSFSALRPSSLPVPSLFRPEVRSEKKPINVNLPPQSQKRSPKASPRAKQAHVEAPRPLEPHDEELLKLVAAETPSHRGAWARDSDSWRMFKRRQKGRADTDSPTIEEEDEDDDDDLLRRNPTLADMNPNGESGSHDTDGYAHSSNMLRKLYKFDDIATSLPVTIPPFRKYQPIEGLPSLQPKTSLVDRPGVFVPPLPVGNGLKSPTALRKAAYAERDRSREMDPGILDFADDYNDEEDPTSDSSNVSASRGRQHAFKILKARSEIPDAGMWRSLAT
ncbi:hypothetical protein BD410DRAFT_779952 [Rickenella mellea]|uniref:Uncharacterized protein n=1 Tax=Rickenella mellea TaxID=50990 RepID=A0A4R5XEH9_9AGAM|nr:hypothetical protein BD410DRAFT_779952 [Rickenella mellea]